MKKGLIIANMLFTLATVFASESALEVPNRTYARAITSFHEQTREIKVQSPFFSISEIKKQIARHEVISFDIFDTLLLRPYVNPCDLFVHLERLENVPGFVQARTEAYRAARRKHSEKEDISFDEIYAEIDPKFKPLKSKEMELERQVLTTNPEMKDVFDYALQQGKRIVITSDMYLPTNFLQQVLEEKGYTGFHKIYVSGDQGKVKGSGHLFDYLLRDQNIENAASVLHIGDNEHSDKNMAEKKGLSAIWYQKRIDKLFSENRRAKIFYDEHKNKLDASILLGMLALSKPSGNYWYDFGYNYAGPTILGYMKWLDQQAQKDGQKEILFAARDGYTPEKVFNIIKTDEDIRTHYVYASRRLNKLINFNYKNYELEDLNSILEYYKPKNEFLQRNTPIAKSKEEGIKFIEDNKEIYLELVEKERQKYARYFDQFGLRDKKLILVDLVSWRASAQRVVEAGLPEKDIEGCYFAFERAYFDKYFSNLNCNTKAYLDDFKKFKYNNVLILELFMTAPTPPLDTIDDEGKPVFNKPTADELKRMEIYPYISEGAIRFAQTYVNIFDKKDIYFSPEMLMDWTDLFFHFPTKIDKTNFYNIGHAGGIDNTIYEPLIPQWYTHTHKNTEIFDNPECMTQY